MCAYRKVVNLVGERGPLIRKDLETWACFSKFTFVKVKC